MKFKLINTKTNKEAICDKVTIEGFDYYVSDEKPNYKDWFVNLKSIALGQHNGAEILLLKEDKRVIATTNPNINIFKVVDEVVSFEGAKDLSSFVRGYNKAKETYQFTEKDMIEFSEWCRDKAVREFAYGIGETNNWELRGEQEIKTTKELLQLWKEQQPKTLYYNA